MLRVKFNLFIESLKWFLRGKFPKNFFVFIKNLVEMTKVALKESLEWANFKCDSIYELKQDRGIFVPDLK